MQAARVDAERACLSAEQKQVHAAEELAERMATELLQQEALAEQAKTIISPKKLKKQRQKLRKQV